jgi:chaperonin GroES
MKNSNPKPIIIPFGDRVLIEPLSAEERESRTKTGLVIPDTVAKERPEQGTVIAVGEGKRLDDGRVVPLSIKKGQIVLFSKYGPNEIKVGDKEYLIAKEEDILAIIGNEVRKIE